MILYQKYCWIHFQKTTCFPQLLRSLVLPPPRPPARETTPTFGSLHHYGESPESGHSVSPGFILSVKTGFQEVHKEALSRNRPGTWEQELAWGTACLWMSFLSPPALFTDKALLLLTNCRSSPVHLTRVAVLQSRQNNYWDGTRQETHFLYPGIKMKRGTVDCEKPCIRADPMVSPPVTCMKEGDCLPLRTNGRERLLDFPMQLLFVYRLMAGWNLLPYVPLIPWFRLQCILLLALLLRMISLLALSTLWNVLSYSLWERTDTMMIFFAYTPQAGPCAWYMVSTCACLMKTKQNINQWNVILIG